ncbi:hypothetical protein PGTDC60_1801 [Porphyromonas gingivalis TDC60]|nr:hypothetical protein PGTDC60_1801 [Porphyromonas gingivalis TDC60]
MVRKLFCFGSGSEKFSRHNEKVLTPLRSENTRHNQIICGSYFRQN